MTASYQELKQEVVQIKKRIAALERAFDSVLSKDDIEAINDAREDLKRGRTVSLDQIRKKR